MMTNPARRRSLSVLAAPALAPLLLAPGASLLAQERRPAVPPKPIERTGGPYVPTPWAVVDQMIAMGAIVKEDLVMDLGCGDGRLVIAAAQRHGSRGFGVDIDPELVDLANANARKAGVADRVRFEQQDIFVTDVREATVLTLYLLPSMMMSLRPRLWSDLRPGSRIVAHDYDFGDWRPDEQITFDVPEKVDITGTSTTSVYLWIVPVRVAGRWQLSAPGAARFDRALLSLRQSFRGVDGSFDVPGRAPLPLDGTSLRGHELRFGLPVEASGKAGRAVFRGRVDGDRIEGTIASTLATDIRFSATRLT